ncbi:mechanosensitive ion channel family protein [Nocardioides aurantiacus]|uniref:mechanosensitive ion channel family protein n=1 Tax=Nocardioides aurantiacus TaxID=86796 RepID=UPI00403F4348
MSTTDQPWFAWALVVIIGLPVLVLVLSEVHLRLQRRGSPLAGPLNRLRLWLVPLAALLVLLTQAADLSRDSNSVRLVATLVGILAVGITLGALNAVLFGNATEGTWRDRLPSIFVDLARLVLVASGAAIVASLVWNLDVSGLFAALGVGSIVIGLALQNAVGSVVSGLLLLFEQPFKIGDTLDVDGTSGKVVEMNWRSTHLDTGTGIQVIPNATIADASFANYSRPTPAHDHVVTTSFAPADSPHDVMRTLMEVAEGIPFLRAAGWPSVRMGPGGAYETTLPLVTAGQSAQAQSLFLIWLWYAARRSAISLDGESFVPQPKETVVQALRLVRSTLGLTDDEVDQLADACAVETYGQGETMIRAGVVPDRFAFIVAGHVRLVAQTSDGAQLDVVDLERGDVLGAQALLRQQVPMTGVAATNVEVLQIPLSVIDELVGQKPRVARTLNAIVEARDTQMRHAFKSLNSSEELAGPVQPALASRVGAGA